MNLNSHLVQRMLRLPPPLTRDLTVERDLRVPMRDGAVLLADRWAPKTGGDGLPTALLRIPYGRAGMAAGPMVRPLAERGFQVLIQSTRGTFGSDGPFDPLRREREDGLDTLEWVIRQPWFGESMILYGASYLGFVQWAVADAVPPHVKAIIPAVSESGPHPGLPPRGRLFPGDPVRLGRPGRRPGTPLRDATPAAGGEEGPTRPAHAAAEPGRRRRLGPPLRLHPEHPRPRRRRTVLAGPRPPPPGRRRACAGEHRRRLVRHLPARPAPRLPNPSGRRTFPLRLTVGPWSHISMGVGQTAAAEAFDFGLALARGEEPVERAPVRLFVMGEEKWRDFPSWPPPGYEPRRLHLQPGGALSAEAPADSSPDGYRYDPADPTPAVGGVRMAFGVKSGRVDNTALEARPDVHTYTTSVLDEDAEVIGEVSAEIFFRSSLPYADVFVRLCDVDADGRSTNVCDGLISLTGADELTRATVTLWPTAYRFKRGHRIRVQVSSGAFPRYNRNPGTGEPRSTAATLRAADQQVYHDPQHPSAVILPMKTAS